MCNIPTLDSGSLVCPKPAMTGFFPLTRVKAIALNNLYFSLFHGGPNIFCVTYRPIFFSQSPTSRQALIDELIFIAGCIARQAGLQVILGGGHRLLFSCGTTICTNAHIDLVHPDESGD